MLNLAGIFIGHLVGDGLFAKWLKNAKRRSLFYLGVHSGVYAVTVMVFIYVFMPLVFAWWKTGVLFISHFAIDYWKCYIAKVGPRVDSRSFWLSVLDQMLHLLFLAYVIFG